MAEKKSSTKRVMVEDGPKTTVLASAPAAEKKEPKPKKAEENKPVAVAASLPPAPEPVRGNPVVSFERWFAARSKERRWKPHWIRGMRAYANTSGRKSLEEWDRIFANY